MVRKNDYSGNLGCTIVTVTIDDKIFFLNNEDYERPEDGTFILFVPPQEIPAKWNSPDKTGMIKIFGFSLVGSKFGNLAPQGGINSEGLCYDINALPPNPLKKQEGEPWDCTFNFYDILWTNRTVEDVINWFKTHKFPSDRFSYQIHVADAIGDVVVIGLNEDGEMVFTRKGDKNYLVSTHFDLVNIKNGNHPCNRYDAATEICERLVKRNDVTLTDCEEILDAAHIEYKNEVGTLYSNIFDLKEKKIYLYHIGKFDRKVEFDLLDELVFKDEKSEADLYQLAGATEERLQFDGLRVYTISKLFEK
jgi:hypothetical protein